MTEVVSKNYFFLHNTEIQGKHMKYEGRCIFIQALIGIYVSVREKVSRFRNIGKNTFNAELFIFVETNNGLVQFIFLGS